MSDLLISGFRAQLNTAMESLLHSVVCEVMTIFENSLHHHQQGAALQLGKPESGGVRKGQTSQTRAIENQHVPEVAHNHLGQTSGVPEIDFEVPDDWCAPLGHEILTKQDGVLSSRVFSHDVDSPPPTKGIKRSKRGSHGQQKRPHSVRMKRKKLHLKNRQQSFDQADSIGSRRKDNHFVVNSRKVEGKIPTTKLDPIKKWKGEKRYTCKFCKKVFDTEFGQRVHVRSHKRCRGCKKDFPYPSTLEVHKSSCVALKIFSERQASKTNPPTPVSHSGKKRTLRGKKKRVSVKSRRSAPASHHRQSSPREDGSPATHACAFCGKTCRSSSTLVDHMRVHSSEKMFPCGVCAKKFYANRSLKIHFGKMHQSQMDAGETNGDLAWTVPLEDTEGNPDNGTPSSKRRKSHT